MTDDELEEAVEKSCVEAKDIVDIMKDYSIYSIEISTNTSIFCKHILIAWILYNLVMGPSVETCVCALCNDFGIKPEGKFYDNARQHLRTTYKVGCTKERWNAFSTLEKRFRHVVDINQGTSSDPERYFISERGIKSQIGKSKEWEWWTDDAKKPKDFSKTKIFVCHACNTPATGHPSFADVRRSCLEIHPAKHTTLIFTIALSFRVF